MTQSRFIATSLKEVASVFGVQSETIRTWISRGCPAVVGDSQTGGSYDIAAMIRWCRKNVWVPRQNNSGGSSNRESLKDKILQIEYTERAMGLKKTMGELVEKQSVLVAVSQIFTNVRCRLEALPGEAAAAVPGNIKTDVISQWEHLVYLTLRELEHFADEDPQDPTDERRGPDPVREEPEDQ